MSEYDEFPPYDVVPAPKGKWRLRRLDVYGVLGETFPRWYMRPLKETYDTKEEAERDALHLGLGSREAL